MKALRYASKKSKQKVSMPVFLTMVVLILVPFIVWLLALQQKAEPTQYKQKIGTSEIIDRIESTNPVPSAEEGVKESYYTHRDEKYTLVYPRSWKVLEEQFEGGRRMLIRPSYLTDDVFVPSMSVTVSENIAHPYLTERMDIYEGLGFKKDSTYLGGSFAQRLRGQSPNDEVVEQETHVFLNKGGYGYEIVYRYQSPQVNRDFEKVFEDVVSTFTFR